MYPESMIGNRQGLPAASPNLSSQVSSLGLPPEIPVEKPNPVMDQAEQLINRFGSIASDLKNLSSEYPNATEEYNLLVVALKNWLAKASDGISSGSGGESATY